MVKLPGRADHSHHQRWRPDLLQGLGAEVRPALCFSSRLAAELRRLGEPDALLRGRIMILGMSLATFTMVHVIISLIAIVAGLVVMFGMLGSAR
jgi:hypothetical protein